MDAEVDRFRVLSVCQQFCFGFISIHRHVTAETVFEKPRNFFVGDISRSYARCCYVGVYYSTYLLTYDTTYFYDNDTILPLATVAVRAPCRLSVPMPSSQAPERLHYYLGSVVVFISHLHLQSQQQQVPWR